MTEEPPTNVPNQGPIELQLLAIQRELSFFKAYYVDLDQKFRKLQKSVEGIEHLELLKKMFEVIENYHEQHTDY